MSYIRVAFSQSSSIKFVPTENGGTVLMETFNFVFPKASGMFFEYKNNQFVVTLSNNWLPPPANGLRDTVFYPLYDDFRDEDENQDDYVDENEQDENDDENDGYIDDDHDNNYYDDYDNDYNGHEPQQWNVPQKEDINDLYFRIIRKNDDEESVDKGEEDDYDD